MQTGAVESLTHPCLPSAFQDYSAFAGAFALLGILLTHLIQVIANQVMRTIIVKNKQKESDPESGDEKTITPKDHLDSHATAQEPAELPCAEKVVQVDPNHDHSHGGAIFHSNHSSVYLLELGIATHSVIIGVALGVARAEFDLLLIALVFHQFFEGIALGSVVIEAEFKRKLIAIAMVAMCTFGFALTLYRLFEYAFGSCDRHCYQFFL